LSPEQGKEGLARMLSLTHALDVLQNENINAFVKSEIPFAL
jgi:hypothetical protein